MTAEAPGALCLDITRLVQRADGGPLTGIDRVELAYLRAFCQAGRPVVFLCRTALGWLVLDQAGGQSLCDWIAGEPLPPTGPVARFLARRRRRPGLEAALRPRAQAVLPERRLASWLRTTCPGASWVAVGHTNLDERLFRRLSAAGARIVVMIHDTIPLDHPEWSGPGAPARFRAALAATLGHADLVLCPSRATQAAIARHARGPSPAIHAAPLGVAPAPPRPALLPPDLDLTRRYFLALGTVEPRKDHLLLLDVWRGFHGAMAPADIPRLIICGRRGWGGSQLFDRLATDPAIGATIRVLPGLPDGAVSALLQGAAGLLAPSRAEGFGLPAAEAASFGLPVLATNLPVTREILGDWPTYLPAGSVADWSRAILSAAGDAKRRPSPPLPDWTAHFNCVFNFLG